ALPVTWPRTIQLGDYPVNQDLTCPSARLSKMTLWYCCFSTRRRAGTVPSLFTHAVAACGISACFYKSTVPRRVWIIGTACSLLPDVDVIGFRLGIRCADFWGHRGFTHSLLFAALLAAIITVGFRRGVAGMQLLLVWAYFFLVTVSHGFLDAMTDG